MACVNPNSPEFKAALERTGNPLLAEIELNKGTKPGVEELFNSNPELANQVYEALGFNDNNFELKENKEAFGKEPHPEGATSYDIFSNGRKIGKIALFEGKNPMIKGLNLNESERNKGLGKALYKWLNYKAILKGGRLYADQEFISPDAQRVWESLNKEGLVDLTGASPKFNDKQKQQALQAYSQYLDTIFPDSKVKDIVYHSRFNKENITNKDRWKNGFYSGTKDQADLMADMAESASNNIMTTSALLINLQNPKVTTYEDRKVEDYKDSNDGFIIEATDKDALQLIGDRDGYNVENFKKEYVVFEPEQIHILGNKQDIEGFQKFVSGNKTMFQKEGMSASKASSETLEKVKKVIDKMGVSLQDLATYLKGNQDVKTKGINGLADLVKGIIAIAEGKEDVALTEEMVHIATAILEQANPKLVTEMISKIDRFKIYKQVYEQYKNVYTLPNGKPDIRKIKKEAVDKLIVELIINESEGTTEFPELMEEVERSTIRNWWNAILDFFKGQYRKSNIDIFGQAAETIINDEFGNVSNIQSEDVFYQVTKEQQDVIDKLKTTKDSIQRVESKEQVPEPLSDTDEANNWYEMSKPDGTVERIKNRVTDFVKAWYAARFKNKVFSKEEKAFNELKRTYGIEGHKDFEEMHGRYYNSDGTKKAKPDARPTKFNLPSQEMYDKLEKYYVDLIESFPDGTLILSESIVYDPKDKRAGTIDFLAIEPSGKAHILDWKFMQIAGDDVAWFKQGAFNLQLGTYKKILRDHYGIKEFGMIRAIPISMDFGYQEKGNNKTPLVLTKIAIGSVDKNKMDLLKLVPVSEETESTGYEKLDNVISKLNALLAQIQKEEVIDEDSREFKHERLNVIRKAIRLVQGTNNIAPLIDVISIMREEGDQILNDYKASYKDRLATSKDSTDKDLSEFSEKMKNYLISAQVFVNIGRDIGDLVYTDEMMQNAKSDEEKQAVAERKSIFEKLRTESDKIYNSYEEIENVTKKFADKHIGERNLVTGLTLPEAVVKGLASTFRGVSELPMRALKVLYKLTTVAQGKASKAALEHVTTLMDIRKRLVDRGGDTRKLVQMIYQKDEKGNAVNKLIHRYSREFHDTVDEKAAKGGDKQWLLENIDVEKYKEEAKQRLENQINNINRNTYSGEKEENEKIKEKYIEQAKRMWDIDDKNFNGWNNYIIKRHPLPKWYSDQYKTIRADKDLNDLYEFIVGINEEAKEAGYIQNAVAKTFLPFVKKGSAEQLAWDHSLSVISNFTKSLKIDPSDTGYGKFNELTGELENSIPKYYTQDFTKRENGVNDYSEVSEDLFKNMILYIQHMEKYKYLSEVEGQIQLVKTIEQFKSHLATNRTGEVIKENGNLVEIKGNAENTKTFDDFMRVLLYGQKYVLSDTDTPINAGKVLNFVKKSINNVVGKEVWKIDEEASATSLVKSMDAVNRAFQLKTLGLELVSGGANMFGGNIQVITQSGDYFKAREFIKNEAMLMGQKFESEDEKEIFAQLINVFMPLKEDPNTEIFKNEAGLTTLTRHNLGDMLMVFMRKPEQLIEKSIFTSLLQNMMVENGKIVSISDFVKRKYKGRSESATAYKEAKVKIEQEIEELKKTKSIAVTKKLVNGKLEIPGLDLNNIDEIQRLTQLTRRLSRNATGSLSDGDINKMSMSVWTSSMMLFKNWIPKLADTRFSEFRKVSDDFSVTINEKGVAEGHKYDVGRIRLLLYVLGTSMRDRSLNIVNIINMNEKGIAAIDKMYEEFAAKYEKTTGETLTMTKDEFTDMIRNNLRNEMKELAILAGLMGTLFSVGLLAPDDDKDKATKNRFRYGQRVLNKFVDELSFFYNPINFESLLSGSIFPAVGLINDHLKFITHFTMETTGFDISDPTKSAEDVRKSAHPIKYLAKALPITKSLITYGAILNSEFAKEHDITIQKQQSSR